jgi:hypothetical protein
MQPKIQNGWQYNVRKLFGLIDQNVGAKAGTGVSVTEQSGALKKTVLELDDVSVTMTDAAANGSQGSLKIYDFPAGNIVFVAATTDLTISRVGTAITATAAVVGGVGTAVAATDNATLTLTEADLVPSTTATLTAGAGTFKGKSLTAGIAVFDGTTTAKDAYLNFAIPDAGSTGNDALLVNGTITILWADSGDN